MISLKQGWMYQIFKVDASTQYVPLVLNSSMLIGSFDFFPLPFIALTQTSSDFASLGAPADHFAAMFFGMLKVPLFVVAVMRCMLSYSLMFKWNQNVLSFSSCWNFLLKR